jgi:hydrogenase maturation protease
LGLEGDLVAPKPVLVFACGNPSRGDDALGPALLERLAQGQAKGAFAGCDLLTDFQLQVEHALDLVGRKHVIFVDAAASGPEPCALTPVAAETALTYSTHSMSPGGVLRILSQIHPGLPPDTWLLAIRGYVFDLGQPLSAQAQANLDAACALLELRLTELSGGHGQ